MLYFVNKNIESVSNYLPEMERLEMEFRARVRDETLRRLVAMPSYECKTIRWKNIYYEYLRKKVFAEMEANVNMLHITFTDGSNPFVYRGTMRGIKRQLRKWGQNYVIYGTYTRFGIYFATATPKRDPVDLFNFD